MAIILHPILMAATIVKLLGVVLLVIGVISLFMPSGSAREVQLDRSSDGRFRPRCEPFLTGLVPRVVGLRPVEAAVEISGLSAGNEYSAPSSSSGTSYNFLPRR